MLWWQVVLGVVVGLICLMVIVVVHELGHAFLARRGGVVVEEFGLGFPPRAKVLGKYKGTLVTLNWLLPIGGFCRMKGEADDAKSKGSYGAASFWVKTQILFAGVVANFILAAAIFALLSLFGMPKVIEGQWCLPQDCVVEKTQVQVANEPAADSPAGKVGLQKGDAIVSLAGHEVKTFTDLKSEEYRGQTVPIVYLRGGEEVSAEVTLRENGQGGYLGIAMGQNEYYRATWSAPLVGVVNTTQFVGKTVEGLGVTIAKLCTGLVEKFSSDAKVRENGAEKLSEAGDGVSGPVSILGAIFPNAMMMGSRQLLFVAGIISLTLTVMNLLPIPGLDGGRWLLTAIFKLLRRPLTEEVEGAINGVGMVFLYGLIAVVVILDVVKLW